MGDNNHQFIIRSFKHGDERAINDMFCEVFNQKRGMEHWYWKYRDNPYGSHFISLAATKDGVIAAHYAGFPVKIYCFISGDESPTEIKVLQLGDKMTRAKYRSAGFGKSALLTKVYLHFRDTYSTGAIPFMYGFAANHSLKFGLLILNYADIEPVPYRKLDMNMIGNLKESPLRSFSRKTKIEEISLVDTRWTDFFDQVSPSYRCLVKRDATYLRWRYLQRPDRKYLLISVKRGSELIGWSVFYREANKIIWGDALFNPGDSDYVKSVLKYLHKHPMSDGADFIECWFPKRPAWWDSILNSLGFMMEAEPNNIHFTAPIFYDSEAPGMLRRFFYYTMGDSDLF